LSAFAQLEARIKVLEEKLEKLTPQNSSIPPNSSRHGPPRCARLIPTAILVAFLVVARLAES